MPSRVRALAAVAAVVAVATVLLAGVGGQPSGDPTASTASTTAPHTHVDWLARPVLGDRVLPLAAFAKRGGRVGLLFVGVAAIQSAIAVARRRNRSRALLTGAAVQRVPLRRRGPPALA